MQNKENTINWKARKENYSGKKSKRSQNDYLYRDHIGRLSCRMGRYSQIRRPRPINAAMQHAAAQHLFLRCGTVHPGASKCPYEVENERGCKLGSAFLRQ